MAGVARQTAARGRGARAWRKGMANWALRAGVAGGRGAGEAWLVALWWRVVVMVMVEVVVAVVAWCCGTRLAAALASASSRSDSQMHVSSSGVGLNSFTACLFCGTMPEGFVARAFSCACSIHNASELFS